ncbi:hypothetical protein [Methylobacterium sp. Leaf86]|uniref:hypothetical protein n=1 Tax=Methylobacterium sp. Leaf86 TaxID=1736242 RepID=UPI000AEF9A93|nr:hypothetical protein [Methylobacterium sp. Leaf86]
MSDFAIKIHDPPDILKRDRGPWYAPDLATAKKKEKYRPNYIFEHDKCSRDIVISEGGPKGVVIRATNGGHSNILAYARE